MNFESLLITPVQRIPRYNLLLQDLIKNTSKDHPDYGNSPKRFVHHSFPSAYQFPSLDTLCKALDIMKEVSLHLNESVKKTDNLRKLAEASSKGAGFR